MTTPKTGSPEWAGSQATPNLTVNEALRRIEGGARFFVVVDRSLSAPPGACADGACYIVAAGASGAWAGHVGDIAQALGANASNGWAFQDPEDGVFAYVQDEGTLYAYDAASPPGWVAYSPGGNPVEFIGVAVSDETTALTAGTAKATFRLPYGFTLTAIRGSLSTAQTSGSIFTVDVNENGASILSTKLTIDNGEKTSTTAATPAVISDANLADDAEITIDIDALGDGTAKGLKVYLIGTRA